MHEISIGQNLPIKRLIKKKGSLVFRTATSQRAPSPKLSSDCLGTNPQQGKPLRGPSGYYFGISSPPLALCPQPSITQLSFNPGAPVNLLGVVAGLLSPPPGSAGCLCSSCPAHTCVSTEVSSILFLSGVKQNHSANGPKAATICNSQVLLGVCKYSFAPFSLLEIQRP